MANSTGTTTTTGAHVVWESPIFNPGGFADEARNFVYHLTRLGIDVAIRPVGLNTEFFRAMLLPEQRDVLDRALTLTAGDPFICVQHGDPQAFHADPHARYVIGRAMYETDRIPPSWLDSLKVLDEVWVPARFNVETFRASGLEIPIYRVPEGIDTDQFRPGLPPLVLPGARGQIFLSVFSWQVRKGWDVLLRAWALAFTARDDVSLVLRTYLMEQPDRPDGARIIDQAIDRYLSDSIGMRREDLAPIVVLADTVSEADLPRLFASADCYVGPSRGEGWGRPYMMAMACGLPAIATRWSGNLDFMNDDNSLLIEVEDLVPVRSHHPEQAAHLWAEPRVEHLASLMWQASQDRALASRLGQKARSDMVEHWSWQSVAQIALDRLHEISDSLPIG